MVQNLHNRLTFPQVVTLLAFKDWKTTEDSKHCFQPVGRVELSKAPKTIHRRIKDRGLLVSERRGQCVFYKAMPEACQLAQRYANAMLQSKHWFVADHEPQKIAMPGEDCAEESRLAQAPTVTDIFVANIVQNSGGCQRFEVSDVVEAIFLKMHPGLVNQRSVKFTAGAFDRLLTEGVLFAEGPKLFTASKRAILQEYTETVIRCARDSACSLPKS